MHPTFPCRVFWGMGIRVVEYVWVFHSAGGPTISSSWRAPVRHRHVSHLRPEAGFAWGHCIEVEGIMAYELIGKKKRQINNEVD